MTGASSVRLAVTKHDPEATGTSRPVAFQFSTLARDAPRSSNFDAGRLLNSSDGCSF
jgi:hypothetical protein